MRLIDADALWNSMEAAWWYSNNDRDEIAEKLVLDAPTVSRWIPVEEKLPEDEGDVLTYCVSPRGRKTTAVTNYLAFEADRPRWALDGIWTVLYWMPLPNPPEMKRV